MPQPLSSLLSKDDPWSITINPHELAKHPQRTVQVAEVIARASSIEHGLAMILVHVLHASPEPAFAMFSEVMDAGNRRAMIVAAAKAALSADDSESLEAIMSVVRTQIDHRNKFAHWLWGACEQVPDALLLVDPRYLLGHARRLQQVRRDIAATKEEFEEIINAMNFDFDRIYVYREADFKSILHDFRETEGIVNAFASIIDPTVTELDERLAVLTPRRETIVEKARLRLSNQRLFAEALGRLRNKRQKRP